MPAKILEYITIEGFKSIASLQSLELGSINLLIGANGAGKSNFVGLFALLQAVIEGPLERFVAKAGGAENLLHFGSKNTSKISVNLRMTSGIELDLKLESADSDRLVCTEQSISAWRGTPVYGHVTSSGAPFLEHLIPVVGWLAYHFHDTSSNSAMRKTPKVDDNRFLRPDGSNLSAFLYFLRGRHTGAYDLIRKTVQRVAPFVEDFILEPRSLAPDSIRLEWKHRNSDRYFDVSSLSDGTLRFMALATLLLQPMELRPSLILVDEPELGLHPYAIGLLASMIQQAAVDTQVIVSTQSPLLLDYFEPEDVIVADCVCGATQLKRLESERLQKWLEDYSLGQLWEKNEIGGRPGSI